MAKYIRSENPARFELRGFLTHEKRIKGMQMLGVPVYTLDQDLAEIVKKERIEGVLVSPLRVEEFRENQEMQDVIIGAGAKILMSQNAIEMSDDSQDDENVNVAGLHMREVSVEDLLPRDEIKVDMLSIGQLLRGKRVLLVDDVISLGGSMRAMEALVRMAGGTTAGRIAVLAEGDAAKRTDIKTLGAIPLFRADGSPLG